MLEGRINELPLGLLSFFGIKTGGRYPASLGSELAVSLELFQLYAAQKKRYLTGGLSGIAATGFATPSPISFAVPNAAVWVVTAYRARVTTGVGVTAFWGPCTAPPISTPFLAGGMPMDGSQRISNAASQVLSVGADWSGFPMGGRVLSPGWRLGIDVMQLTGGTLDLSCDMEYYELPF